MRCSDIGANKHYFIEGNYFEFPTFFHMISLCNFILWVNRKWACITYNSKLPSFFMPYSTLKMSSAIFLYSTVLLSILLHRHLHVVLNKA